MAVRSRETKYFSQAKFILSREAKHFSRAQVYTLMGNIFPPAKFAWGQQPQEPAEKNSNGEISSEISRNKNDDAREKTFVSMKAVCGNMVPFA